MPIRDAQIADLTRIVAIYNAAIPSRMASADTEPVTTGARKAWFRDFDPARRPLWVFERDGKVQGWLSLRSFYGRPAYQATVELAVYAAPEMQRRGIGRELVGHAVDQAPALGVRTMLAFVFGHNVPSLRLLQRFDFAEWGRLPRVAELDGVERDVLILGRRLE